jgi:hypothetical protein
MAAVEADMVEAEEDTAEEEVTAVEEGVDTGAVETETEAMNAIEAQYPSKRDKRSKSPSNPLDAEEMASHALTTSSSSFPGPTRERRLRSELPE